MSPCLPIPGGIVCVGKKRRVRCKFCRSWSTRLCDFTSRGVTCDAPCCELHAVSVDQDVDYCEDHRAWA